eukprot:2746462-Prymnesium_polylepis.1
MEGLPSGRSTPRAPPSSRPTPCRSTASFEACKCTATPRPALRDCTRAEGVVAVGVTGGGGCG